MFLLLSSNPSMNTDDEEERNSLLAAFRAHNGIGRIKQARPSKQTPRRISSTTSATAQSREKNDSTLSLAQASPLPSPTKRGRSDYSTQSTETIARAKAEITAQEADGNQTPVQVSEGSDKYRQPQVTDASVEESVTRSGIRTLAPSPFITERVVHDGCGRQLKEAEAEALVLALIQSNAIRVDWDEEPHVSNLKSLLHMTHLDAVGVLQTWYPHMGIKMLSRVNGQYRFDLQIQVMERPNERNESANMSAAIERVEVMGEAIEVLDQERFVASAPIIMSIS
jgi:hypothetical protein